MTNTPLQLRTVRWLNEFSSAEGHVSIRDIVPLGAAGPTRIHAYWHATSTAWRWALSGLYAFGLGAVLLMFNPGNASAATRTGIQGLGGVSTTAAAVCFATAEVKRRKSRSDLIIDVIDGRTPLSSSAMGLIVEESMGIATWVVTEVRPEAEALSAAQARGMRAFVAGRSGYVEVTEGRVLPGASQAAQHPSQAM